MATEIFVTPAGNRLTMAESEDGSTVYVTAHESNAEVFEFDFMLAIHARHTNPSLYTLFHVMVRAGCFRYLHLHEAQYEHMRLFVEVMDWCLTKKLDFDGLVCMEEIAGPEGYHARIVNFPLGGRAVALVYHDATKKRTEYYDTVDSIRKLAIDVMAELSEDASVPPDGLKIEKPYTSDK